MNRLFRVGLLAGIFWVFVVGPCGVTICRGQAGSADCRKVHALATALRVNHVQPAEPDDAFSEAIFGEFLAALDPEGLYFTEADLSGLSGFRQTIDDEVRGADCAFVKATAAIYKRALQRADSMATQLLSSPVDLRKKLKMVVAKPGKLNPARNPAELAGRWDQEVRYHLLNRLLTPEDSTEKPLEMDARLLLQREPEAREFLKKRLHRSHRRLMEPAAGFEKHLNFIFLNTIAAHFDPHSSYFSPDEMTRFAAEMANQRYAFGFSLHETRQGEFKIARIVPGGSAWKTNSLNEGDVLVHCSIEGGSPLDLADMDLDEFEEKIREIRVRTISLTVRKTDGRHKTVTLRKEKVRDEEGSVRGLMLEGEVKVGYIALPGFYSASDNDPQGGCGNDVAREVIKLKREGMAGLILDLRNNGGGSVLEAAELAGIFLDFGPLFLRRGNDGQVFSVKDPNRGYAWKGPLVILVNGLSASASELVSAALQDYRRAVIVGSPTYGKSSGQNIIPVPGTGDFLKVTSSKFNRVTGSSYQRDGVTPDVQVPDLFDGLDFREASQAHALEGEQIEGNKYFSPGEELPLEALRSHSLDRIDNDSRFVRFSIFSETVRRLMQYPKEIPLDIDGFRAREKERQEVLSGWEDIFEAENSTFTVRTTEADRELVDSDEVRRATYRSLIDKIGKDFIVEEGYRVVRDLTK